MQVIVQDKGFRRTVADREASVSDDFDEAYALSSTQQRAVVEDLLSRVGVIDWEMEGYASPDLQRDLSIKFHWGHNHRFSEDLTVQGRMGNRHLHVMAEFIEGFSLSEDYFRKKSVLDVGCWTGGTSLTLSLMGASHVMALEEVRKYASAAEVLFSQVYKLGDTICQPLSLYSLSEGEFDLVYVPGVVYHLSDPVLGLRCLYNRLRDGGEILVESQGIVGDEPVCRFAGGGANSDENEGQLDRAGWNWFLPTAHCLGAWLEAAGFDEVKVFHSPIEAGKVFGFAKRTSRKEITRAGLSKPDVD